MIVELPDHYAPTIGGAMVERAASVISIVTYVPAYLHQLADAWDAGLRYGGSGTPFWQAVGDTDKALRPFLKEQGLIP